MDHSRAPVLEAPREFRRRGDVVYGPPGHQQGLGAGPRVLDSVGEGVFASDVPSLNGLDDRREPRGVHRAEEPMAGTVGADHAFFSTCGSSRSVKAAMPAVTGPDEKLLVSRDAHKSVIAGMLLPDASGPRAGTLRVTARQAVHEPCGPARGRPWPALDSREDARLFRRAAGTFPW